MRKYLFIVLIVLTCLSPLSCYGQVSVSIGIGLPPPIAFTSSPQLIVLPDTDDVYVCPYVDFDLFFWNGWWWRYWNDRWYCSRYYDSDWQYYAGTPTFYFDVDPDWRVYYLDRDWDGYPWDYEFIPANQIQINWARWHRDRYWERDRNWGVQGAYRPRPPAEREHLRSERQQRYQQSPEARPNQPLRQQFQRVPQRNQPSGVTQPRPEQPSIQQRPQEPARRSPAETSGRTSEPARPQMEQPRVQERAPEPARRAPEAERRRTMEPREQEPAERGR